MSENAFRDSLSFLSRNIPARYEARSTSTTAAAAAGMDIGPIFITPLLFMMKY
jgi:hypothetical protein